MKRWFKLFLAISFMLITLALAIGMGAYRGYKKEYKNGEMALSSLNELFELRRELAYNVKTVAKRQGYDEGKLNAMLKLADGLTAENSISKRQMISDELGESIGEILQELSKEEKLFADERDSFYVKKYFPQILEQSNKWTESEAYNEYAKSFNASLKNSFSGRIASLLGVKNLEYFGLVGGEK